MESKHHTAKWTIGQKTIKRGIRIWLKINKNKRPKCQILHVADKAVLWKKKFYEVYIIKFSKVLNWWFQLSLNKQIKFKICRRKVIIKVKIENQKIENEPAKEKINKSKT